MSLSLSQILGDIMKFTHWRIIGISAGIVLLVGYFVYKILKRKIEMDNGQKSPADNEPNSEFAMNAKAFSGLYEPLYRIAMKSGKFRTGVIGDWATRTENLGNARSYVNYWQTNYGDFSNWTPEIGQQKSEFLLSFVLASGICRSDETTTTVDGNTYKKYDYADEMIEENNTANVKSPYWYYGDTILEKGVIEKNS